MRENFDASLLVVLKFEGGKVDDPRDPGGRTAFGVTQRVYDAYRRSGRKSARDVYRIDKDEIADIYRWQYWQAVRGDDLPAGIDLAVFDSAVNSGPVRAAKWFQAALAVTQDGHIGAITIDAARNADAASVASAVCARRLAWLRSLKTFRTFGTGWTRRIEELRAIAVEMTQPKTGKAGVK